MFIFHSDFIMSLIDYELSLLHTSSVSKFYKSWLIFYRFGLVDAEVRGRIQFEGYMPWSNVNPGNWNSMPWLLHQVGENGNLEEGKRELHGMFQGSEVLYGLKSLKFSIRFIWVLE